MSEVAQSGTAAAAYILPDREAAFIEALLRHSPLPMWISDSAGTIISFNDPFEEYAARICHVQPLRGVLLQSLLQSHPALVLMLRDAVGRVFNGSPVEMSRSYVLDGVRRLLSLCGTPVVENGEVLAAVFSLQDPTDMKGDGERARRISTAVTPLVDDFDSPGDVLTRFCESFGIALAWDAVIAWIGDPLADVVVPDAWWIRRGRGARLAQSLVPVLELPRTLSCGAKLWEGTDVVWVESIRDAVDESWKPFCERAGMHSAVFLAIRDSDRLLGVFGFFSRKTQCRDADLEQSLSETGPRLGRFLERLRSLQERERLHLALARKGTEWTLTFDAIESPILILDLHGTVLRVNRAAKNLAGVESFSDLLGKPIAAQAGDQWRIVSEMVDAIRDSRSSLSSQCHDPDRGRYWDIDASLYTAASIEDDRVIVILRDITRLVELQESVRRGEQLSSMGELVAGVAHEVRNPLFGMGLTLDTLEMMIVDPELREMTGALRQWIERLNILMNRLLEYGKSWTISLVESDITDVISQSIDACRAALDEHSMTAVCRVRGENTRMLIDPPRLQQVFENLVTNAIQHSTPNSLVLIDVSNVPVDGRPYIECDVRDFGIGFQPEDMPRVFQPFFTRRRGGTGLGLSIVQRIVEQHGGTIEAMNSPDGGALLRMRFPVPQVIQHSPARNRLRPTEGRSHAEAS